MEQNNINIFSFFSENKLDEFFNLIKDNKNKLDLDIYDDKNIFVIQYIINLNRPDILQYIFDNFETRIDILDNDGRNLLYYPIKFNFTKIIDLIINKNKKTIGIDILDIRDKMGFISLHYCCIFNNFDTFRKLYKLYNDIFISNNNNDNLFDLCLKYKRNTFLLYLFDNEFKKGNYNFINNKNENIFYNALVYENNDIINYLMKFKEYIQTIMNHQEPEFGLTILHQMIITNNNKYIEKLIEFGIDINISDNYGNYPYHYAILENNISFLKILINKNNKINYNNTNINGETVLHLFLTNFDDNILGKDDLKNILLKLIENTNLNIQTNEGITCLHLLIDNNFLVDKDIIKILESGKKELNIFISDNENLNGIERINNNKDYIEIIVSAYFNRLKFIKEKLNINWEKYCAENDINNVMKSLNKKSGDVEHLCKDKIRKTIIEDKNSVPRYEDLNLNFDNDIVMNNNCFYTGSTLDIVFGLIFLNKFPNVNFILSYPLSENSKLNEYYKKIGNYNSNKFEFNNIEIIWSFHKLILIENFESLLIDNINKDKRFIIIPLGIELAEGSHANIIIIDKKNKTIERFEPNGSNEPRNFPYNKNLLDNLLKNKFQQLLMEYTYIKPSEYLPIIGFQMLEIINDNKCKMIGDPNGYCAVWCIFYAKYRLENPDVKQDKLVYKIINNIKLQNKNFKLVIRNFSKNISSIRDNFLKKYNMDINDWMNSNYNLEILKNLEQDLIDMFN
jgi:ankyrin repeat protein